MHKYFIKIYMPKNKAYVDKLDFLIVYVEYKSFILLYG
jgi:hypothetical protein